MTCDYNVMPTDLDVYKPERWVDDALFRPEVRDAFRVLAAQGWTDAVRALHSGEPIYTFWDYFRSAYSRNAGLRIDHLLLSPAVAGQLVAANVDRDVRGWERRAITLPRGMNWPTARLAPEPGPLGMSKHDRRRGHSVKGVSALKAAYEPLDD